MKLELNPEIEAGLLAQARENGMSLEAFAEDVLRREALRSAQAPEHPAASELPIWETITEMVRDIPDAVFDRLPKDAASQVDHYLYGLPKRD